MSTSPVSTLVCPQVVVSYRRVNPARRTIVRLWNSLPDSVKHTELCHYLVFSITSAHFSSLSTNTFSALKIGYRRSNHTYYTVSPPPQTRDFIFYNNFNNKCPITIFLAQLVVSLCVIESWFHFLPHLSSETTLPWEITEDKNDQFRRKQHIVL